MYVSTIFYSNDKNNTQKGRTDEEVNRELTSMQVANIIMLLPTSELVLHTPFGSRSGAALVELH